MKGSVYKYGKGYRYMFDADPDPLTGKRRQITKGGFATEKAAWSACREAMTEYDKGRHVMPSKRTVKQLLEEWLTRRQHKIKPSMLANYRNYAKYYVYPYIGHRVAQDLDSAVFDALYAHLLKEGRVKARPEHRKALAEKDAARAKGQATRQSGRRRGPAPQPKPPRPTPPPGLAPKTVVNVHRMLHRAWQDGTLWRYLKRNVVAEASPPRVPRKGPNTWTIDQLQRFVTVAREDRFFALWVLEATTGMRRCELAGARREGIDFQTGTIQILDTRVVIDGKVDESDGKSRKSWRTIALDPYTLALLRAHLDMLDKEHAEWGPDYQDHGLLFCWPDGRPPHPDTITRRFQRLAQKAGLPPIKLHEARHSYATAGRRVKVDPKALSQRVGHASVSFTMQTYMHGDVEADREVATALAHVILSGLPRIPPAPTS